LLLPVHKGLATELEEANDFGGHGPVQGAHLSGREVTAEQQREAENGLISGVWELSLKKLTPRQHSLPSPDQCSSTLQHPFTSLLPQVSPTGFFCPYNIQSLSMAITHSGIVFFFQYLSASGAKFLKH